MWSIESLSPALLREEARAAVEVTWLEKMFSGEEAAALEVLEQWSVLAVETLESNLDVVLQYCCMLLVQSPHSGLSSAVLKFLDDLLIQLIEHK